MAGKKETTAERAHRRAVEKTRSVGKQRVAIGRKAAKFVGKGRSAITGKKAPNKRILQESKEVAHLMVTGTIQANRPFGGVAPSSRKKKK